MTKKIGFIILTAFLLSFSYVHAQGVEPTVLITWKATTYAPASFEGRVLPTGKSNVSASVLIIDKGKLASLSGEIIYWYLNGNFIGGGVGVREVSFATGEIPGGTLDLRAQLPNYGARPGYDGIFLVKTIEVPIARPDVVIEAPFALGHVFTRVFHLFAQPYFFNVSPSSLLLQWNVNGENPKNSESPEFLNITLPPDLLSGYNVNVGVRAANPENILEAAVRTIDLTFIQ